MSQAMKAFLLKVSLGVCVVGGSAEGVWGQDLWGFPGGTEPIGTNQMPQFWRMLSETSTGALASASVLPRPGRRYTEFTGTGDPSNGGTTLIVGTLNTTLLFSPPPSSVRSAARTFVNAEFDASAVGSQGVVLHFSEATGACSFGGIDMETGSAFIATRQRVTFPFVLRGSQAIPGYVRGQSYEVLLTSGETRMVLHVYSRGTLVVRIPVDGLVLAAGQTGIAMLAATGQTSSLRGSFRSMTGQRTTSIDTANDGVSDILWLNTRENPRNSVAWNLHVGSSGTTQIAWTIDLAREFAIPLNFSREQRVVSVKRRNGGFSSRYGLLNFSLVDGSGSNLEDGSVGEFSFNGGWSLATGVRIWDALVRDSFRLQKGEWSLRTLYDFDRSGSRDQLWHNRYTGEVSLVLQDSGFGITSSGVHFWGAELSTRRIDLPNVGDTNWHILGAGDIDDDGFSDILWHNQETGLVVAWYLDATRLKRWVPIETLPSGWSFVGIGSYDRIAGNDIMWRNDASGLIGFWSLTAGAVTGWQEVAVLPDAEWIGGG